MSISVEAIRKLNEVKFIIECMDDPAVILNEGTFVSASSPATQHTAPIWTFSVPCSGGISLAGQLSNRSFFGDIFKNVKLLDVGKDIISATTGIVPQLDIPRKYLYKGTEPMSFNLSLYLLLDEDPINDFLAPLLRLACLVFPSRGLTGRDVGTAISNWVDTNQAKLDAAVAGNEDLGQAFKDFWRALSQGFDKVQGFVEDAAGDIYDRYIGSLAVLLSPPPFDPRSRTGLASSGLSIRYGSSLITDVFIESINLSIPPLYYEGGYAPYMKVDIKVSTLRVATFDLFANILQGKMDDGTAVTGEAGNPVNIFSEGENGIVGRTFTRRQT